MSGRGAYLLSFPAVAIYLGALTVGLVLLGRYYALGLLGIALLAIPVVLAIGYLAWYRTLPYEQPVGRASARAGAAEDDEPFEDPVEEADRLDEQGPTPEDDDAEPDEPPENPVGETANELS